MQPFFLKRCPVQRDYFFVQQYLRLKNCATILLLISFLVFQYARQLSYWECRLFNSFRAGNETCDCEALVKTITGPSNAEQLPAAHNHVHIDESFYPARIDGTISFYTQLPARPMTKNYFIPARLPRSIDRPPQIS